MRSLLGFLALAALCYASLLLAVYLLQPRMLYLPQLGGPRLGGTPADIGLAYEDVHFTSRDGIALHGWFVPARAARRSGRVVLHAHGNGGNISHRLGLLQLLHALDVDVLLFDYRGYGQSEGRPSEPGTYDDVRAAWDYLVRRRGFAPSEVVLFGHSLGAAVVAHLAREVQPAALILEAPFTSSPDVASHHYWFLPARRLVRFRYATVEYVRTVRAPVLVVHSRADGVVPFEHGLRVYEAVSAPKDFLEITGGHNAASLPGGTSYSAALRDFLERHAPPGARLGDSPDEHANAIEAQRASAVGRGPHYGDSAAGSATDPD